MLAQRMLKLRACARPHAPPPPLRAPANLPLTLDTRRRCLPAPRQMVLLCCVVWALGRGHEQWHYNAGYAIAYGGYLSWSFVRWLTACDGRRAADV